MSIKGPISASCHPEEAPQPHHTRASETDLQPPWRTTVRASGGIALDRGTAYQLPCINLLEHGDKKKHVFFTIVL